ncbi:AlpA family phage regulatory protein [Pseudomonas shirazica]
MGVDCDERLLKFESVCGMVGLSRTTLWRLEKVGAFPRRIKVTSRCVRWRHSEVKAWIDQGACTIIAA